MSGYERIDRYLELHLDDSLRELARYVSQPSIGAQGLAHGLDALSRQLALALNHAALLGQGLTLALHVLGCPLGDQAQGVFREAAEKNYGA